MIETQLRYQADIVEVEFSMSVRLFFSFKPTVNFLAEGTKGAFLATVLYSTVTHFAKSHLRQYAVLRKLY
jgi:hypothetical protein